MIAPEVGAHLMILLSVQHGYEIMLFCTKVMTAVYIQDKTELDTLLETEPLLKMFRALSFIVKDQVNSDWYSQIIKAQYQKP
ncbi:MAG: hypothetical protein KME32_35770 [Mojavia pulchra JT2-VF2]|jgi:hypothetical protein|uniref:Uncharacterized protein n=1 Tax=Mojavia pulchra JT2-VF2 TaxID=287848 RepID=A0A951Q6L5_9NOST|nr:hypothetical protein [Mojavia pulchra JT2-VF2]